ncbi:MAG: ATP-binding protein [Patescibacteria group bacterium]
MIGSIAYAIVAHRLFDIRVIIKRTVIFAGLSAFVLGTYALIILATATILGGGGEAILASRQMIPNLVAALGIALGFDPLRKWLTVRTDKWLFKGEYTPQAVLQELSETLANVVDLGEAVEEMMQIVTKAMRLNKSAAFLIQPSDTHGDYELKQLVTVGYQRKEGMQQIAPKDSLLQYFLHTNIAETKYQPVVAEELSRQLEEGSLKGERAQLTNDFLARLTGLEAAVALPLFIRRQQPVPTPPGSPPRFRDIEIFIGILTLSEKKSGDAFTDQDLNLLSIVASQTAGAVEKSRLFEEDQLKSEFVSIASHELLTPTAAMEGYLSMILEEGMGKVDKQARGYLETVYRESKRLASLVKDLLNVSRIERGKIVVHPAPLDLAELIKQVLESLKFRAEERRIKLTLTMKDKLPKVMADSEKLTEVMVNLIGNSIKYTHEGGQAAITTETRNGQVLVHIKDNGIGMKPEDVQHLFTKFFRASNSDQTNQGGTGLGLYITKNIIELMGGTIGVESELNKGSTFTFSLPVAK